MYTNFAFVGSINEIPVEKSNSVTIKVFLHKRESSPNFISTYGIQFAIYISDWMSLKYIRFTHDQTHVTEQ